MKNILFIVGPTGVGKSRIALELAKAHDGEIVSCDSMQVYREINIISDKPNELMLKDVPHHLINILSVEDEFDVAHFRKLAVEAIEDILSRNKLPIVVGGSGMYMQILLDGIFEGAGKSNDIREKLEQRAQDEGAMALYHELLDVDPESAKKIESQNVRRVIRALEVYHTTGQPISKLQPKRQGLWDTHDCKLFCLDRPREEVYERINARVDQMINAGAVDEVKSLKNKKMTSTVSKLIGISEILAHLDGEHDLDRATYLIKRNTRHFAKRQLTWFRKETRLNWINIDQLSLEDVSRKFSL